MSTDDQHHDTAPGTEAAETLPGGAPPGPDGQPATFDREYVQKLRDEAAGHRVRAKRADALVT